MTAPALLLATALLAAAPGGAYEVRWNEAHPDRLSVSATLPATAVLAMHTTRPGDLPDLLENGWPALVRDLRVKDADGHDITATSTGDEGWRLPSGLAGPLSVRYDVDLSLLADAGWPAPRESGYADADTRVLCARSLFVTAEAQGPREVSFVLPQGWRALAPWARRHGRRSLSFRPESRQALVENLVVLTRTAPGEVTAKGFRVTVVPMGPWSAVAGDVEEVAAAHVRNFVALMGHRGRADYLVVLLPMPDRGAESYRASAALTHPGPPTRADRAAWGNLLGHEMFHYWNGWRLAGADSAATQWFQEGFTEYAANRSMAEAGFLDAEGFRQKLSAHVANARRLETSLENIGTRKGPPLYSAGTLTAFCLDILVRDATGGARDLGHVLRALWKRTGAGARPYTRADIEAALEETAPGDWGSFLDRHVAGRIPLPLEDVLARVGHRLVEGADGTPRIEGGPARLVP